MLLRNENDHMNFIMDIFLHDEELLHRIKRKVYQLLSQTSSTTNQVDDNVCRDYVNQAIDIILSEVGAHNLIRTYFMNKKKETFDHDVVDDDNKNRTSLKSHHQHQHHHHLDEVAMKTMSPERKNKGKTSPKSSPERKKHTQVQQGGGGEERLSNKNKSQQQEKEKRRQQKEKKPKKFDFNQTYRFSPEDFQGLASPIQSSTKSSNRYSDNNKEEGQKDVDIVYEKDDNNDDQWRNYQEDIEDDYDDIQQQDTEESFYRNEFDDIIASPDPFGDVDNNIPSSTIGMSIQEVADTYSPFPPQQDSGGDDDWEVVESAGKEEQDVDNMEDREKENDELSNNDGEELVVSQVSDHENDCDQIAQDDVVEVQEKDEGEEDYSMGEFHNESPTRSPEHYHERRQYEDYDTVNFYDDGNINKQQPKHVRFSDGVVTSTLYHRMKFTPAETGDLFYTQDEAMQFQYDYDREVTRADDKNLEWYEWIMTRTEEQQKLDEEEDEALQQEAYNSYWGEQEDEEEEERDDDESNDFW